MPESDDYRRDVAGRFLHAMRAKTFKLTQQWFPEHGERIVDEAEREVEEKGLQVENVEAILGWFRSEADAKWLEQFWQSPEGSRFLDLTVELMSRSMYRRFAPHVPVPPPGKSST